MFKKILDIIERLIDASSRHSELATFKGHTEINGISMYYETYGQGEPVLLLHGGTMSGSFSWADVIPTLQDQYKLIVPDSRGHGRSTDTEQPFSYDQFTDDIVALMDHLNIQHAHIVGWSDGGINGMNMGMRYPERLNKLIAYGSNFNITGLSDSEIKTVKETRPETSDPYLAQKTYLDIAPEPDNYANMLEKVVALWLTQPTWKTQDLAKINTPTLILEDSLGKAIKLEHTKVMASAIKGAELILIDDTNHAAPLERPEKFAELVLSFLTQQP